MSNATRDFWVDFNDARDGTVTTLRLFAENPRLVPVVGMTCVVADDEGIRAMARVTSVVGDAVTVKIERVLP